MGYTDILIMRIQLVHYGNIWDYDGNVLVLPSKLGLKKPTASFTPKKTMESMNQPINDGDLDVPYNEPYMILASGNFEDLARLRTVMIQELTAESNTKNWLVVTGT